MKYKIVKLLCTNCRNIVHQPPKVRRNFVSQPLKVFAQPPQIYSTDPQTLVYPALFFFRGFLKITKVLLECLFALFHVSFGWTPKMCHLMLIHLSSDIYYAWSAARSGPWLDSTVSQQRQSRPPKPIWKLSSVNYCFFTPLNPPKWGREKKDPFRQCKCQLLCCHGVIKFLG